MHPHDPLPEAPREPHRASAPVLPGQSGPAREAEPSAEDSVSLDPDPPEQDAGSPPDAEDALQDTGAPSQDTDAPHQDTDAPHQDTEASHQDTDAPHQDTDSTSQDIGEPLQDTDGTSQDIEAPHQDSSTPPPGRTAALPETVSVSEAPPPSAAAAPSGVRPGPPLLASQALMEDLAPVEPLGRQARILCVAAGLMFVVFGVLPLLGAPLQGHPALVPSLVVGAVTLFAAVARVTYRMRAVAMVALGAIVAGLGVAATGPAQGVAEGGAVWSIARFVAAALLPAALLFRARYRAFEGARLLLGLAYLAALPYAVHAAASFFQPAFGFAQVGAIFALALFVAGLPGFMGAETTAAGSYVAPAMVAAFALEAGLHRLGALVPGSLSDLFTVVEVLDDQGEITRSIPAVALSGAALRDAAVTAVAFGATALLSGLGLFQVLAWKFAPAARKIDVRRTPEEIFEERPSIEEWSTRH